MTAYCVQPGQYSAQHLREDVLSHGRIPLPGGVF